MIKISPFSGEIPRLNHKMLPENHAAIAENCDLTAMTLKAERGHKSVGSIPYAQSIYRLPDGTLYRWSSPGVDMVPSPLNNDVWDRLYWTGDGPPKMDTSTMAGNGGSPTGLMLGVPAPSSAMSVSASAPSDQDEGYDITVVYTCTFVSEYGEEGPPAPASIVITKRQSAAVSLTNIPGIPTGGHNIAKKRIYRAEASGSFLLVAELPASTASWTDSVPTEHLGEPLQSLEWDMPDPQMIGLTNIGNGILAGWFDNTLCFCEPYRPHAWPVGYQMGFSANIVGIAPVSNGLIVVTEREPWIVTGASPAAMAQTKLDFQMGGVSRESVVDMGEYAIYASADGLVAVGGSNPSIITENLVSRQQWQQFNPETIRAFRWKERYLAFYDDSSGNTKAFTIDPEQGIVHFSVPGDLSALTYDPAAGELLMKSGSQLLALHEGGAGSFRWRSKIFSIPRQQTLSTVKIDADYYPVSATITADGHNLFSGTVPDDTPFRLPSGRYRDWQIELSGSGDTEVYSVQITGSPTEMM